MILLLNGAFGVGKTTVARELVARIPNAVLFDPELIGIPLQRTLRLAGRKVDDFQDLRAWRWLTVAALRVTRLFRTNVVVPMAFSNLAYLQEIRSAPSQFEPHVHHVCLVAPLDVVQERLRRRGLDPATAPWEFRRAAECCVAHESERFATRVNAADREPGEIAEELLALH